MLLILFQLLDFVVIIALLLGHYDASPWRFLLYMAAYLIIKGIVYRGTWMSWLDIAIGIYLLYLMFATGGLFITWIAVIYMVYKLAAQLMFR